MLVVVLFLTLNHYSQLVNNQTEFGLHGYDNEDPKMHPFFFANGPAFTPGCKLDPFNNIDLFPLFCKILDLECPTVNGTLSHITKCLTGYTASPLPSGIVSKYTHYIIGCVLIILGIFSICVVILFVSVTVSILCVLAILALFTWSIRYWKGRKSGFANIEEDKNRYTI